uniref:Cms1 ribosomal small subunit homolog n=1 Tax=Varanus komodoensis TaxID=61221 RepID=A0A8D2LST0_VARKO
MPLLFHMAPHFARCCGGLEAQCRAPCPQCTERGTASVLFPAFISCVSSRKKKISDMLAKSSPKPGSPEDLQQLLKDHFGAKRSVIELEELKLPDACFLPANDLTHSFSSYLKEICPKWAKLRKNHTEKSSVVMLVICSSALRCLELIKSITAFKGDGKIMKLFAKHIKIQEQMKMLEKSVIHVGVGTPGRIKALVEQDGLNLTPLKYLILDWNWRDQKLRRLVDIPEVQSNYPTFFFKKS